MITGRKFGNIGLIITAHDSKEFKPLESAPGDGSLEKLFDSIGDEVFKILFIQDEEVTVAMQKDLKEKFGNKFRFDTSWLTVLKFKEWIVAKA